MYVWVTVVDISDFICWKRGSACVLRQRGSGADTLRNRGIHPGAVVVFVLGVVGKGLPLGRIGGRTIHVVWNTVAVRVKVKWDRFCWDEGGQKGLICGKGGLANTLSRSGIEIADAVNAVT